MNTLKISFHILLSVAIILGVTLNVSSNLSLNAHQRNQIEKDSGR